MKKILKYLAPILPLAPLLAHAQSVTSSLPLPTSFSSNIMAEAGTLFNDWSSYIELIAGVILAAIVIEILINALRKPNG